MIENSMYHDITTQAFDIELQKFTQPEYKSKMLVGDITIMQTKHFNWLNKIMFKIFFGIKIKDIK